MEDETITEFVRRFKLVKDRYDAARLEENTILGFFLEALQERVLQEVLMQDPTTIQQVIDAALVVDKLDPRVNKVRYEKISMSQYLPVSTKVNPSLEVFISSHAPVIPYGVRPPQVNAEYSTSLIIFLLPSSMPSRSLEVISNIGDGNVESKFSNMRQELLDTMKEARGSEELTPVFGEIRPDTYVLPHLTELEKVVNDAHNMINEDNMINR